MEKHELETLIKAAFKGVQLDGGSSLLQCQAMDERCANTSAEEYANLPQREIMDDWQKVPLETLEEYCHLLAHADAKAFRYYVAAMIIGALNGSEEARSETFFYLRLPKEERSRDYMMQRYEILNVEQHRVIANFLYWLPQFAELDEMEQKQCERTLQAYWNQFL